MSTGPDQPLLPRRPMDDAQVALAAAEAGAAVVRGRLGTTFGRIDKGGGDFATEVDLEAEEAILALLRRRRPDDAIASEEAGRTGPEDTGRLWLVDPLCGTLNFAAGTGPAAVNVALRSGSEVEVGACADPFTGEVFWTDGAEAHVRHGMRNRPAVPSTVSRLVDLNVDTPFAPPPALRAAHLVTDPGLVEAGLRPRFVSSSLALAWVAAGRRVAFVTDGDLTDNVHFAAPLAVCRVAGCVISDLDGGPLSPGPGGLVAAADAVTHAALIDLLVRSAG
jgi:myo-inositol-1(or 4)-monophosphatase